MVNISLESVPDIALIEELQGRGYDVFKWDNPEWREEQGFDNANTTEQKPQSPTTGGI